MTDAEKREAARQFYNKWHGKGNEDEDARSYWFDIMQNILGVQNVTDYLNFEKKVKIDGSTKRIDVYIPETQVLIEQKSLGVSLEKKKKQSDGLELTPYEQAKRYNTELVHDEKARWIIVSNFEEIWIYNMNESEPQPIKIFLEELQNKYSYLEILVSQKIKKLSEEMEISIKAGEIVGKIYDAFLSQYADPSNPETLKSLNMLCVRLVFCLYAEDAGIFDRHNQFHDFLDNYSTDDLRDKIIQLFRVLDQDPQKGERDKYLKDDLKDFPYVNGGLFKDEDIEIPPFTEEIRKLLIEDASENFDWSGISPTIFGALFESTLNPETRRSGGMHYTSVENIHKVIDPLFLDELEDEFNHIIYENALTQAEYKREELDREKQLNDEYIAAMKIENENKKLQKIAEIKRKLENLRYKKSGLSKRRNASINVRLSELASFHDKISSLTFLDPACGSGNFLTETYISLRRLENRVMSEINDIKTGLSGNKDVSGQISFATIGTESENPIRVNISNFYGIEINDFAVTVAKTALWIAESQMMKETESLLHINLRFLPLKTGASIIRENALTTDWQTIVSSDKLNYIMGNPPFVGARQMDKDKTIPLKDRHQKRDMEIVFGKFSGLGNLDYVSAWYKKAAEYINGTAISVAFVSTNSITQGEQPGILWNILSCYHLVINYAYRTFQWDSEAAIKAHVHCVILGFSQKPRGEKTIYDNGNIYIAHNINWYLLDYENVYMERRSEPLCDVPQISMGNQPIDNGYYLFSAEEMKEFISKEPNSEKYFKPWYGAQEFLSNSPRYCLWLGECSPGEISKMPHCMKIVEKVRDYRLESDRASTKKLAQFPTRFQTENMPNGNYIVIPEVSSENRRIIPMGYMDDSVLCSNKLRLMPNAELYHFGILESNVHMAWTRVVCGRLEKRYDYSIVIVYNNFPWPLLDEKAKKEISETARQILEVRKKFSDSSLSDLYNPLLMPKELSDAHDKNNAAVMKAYGFSTKLTEEECVEALLEKYQKIVYKNSETKV